MARRPTSESELDRLVAVVAEFQWELARFRAARRCSCPRCTGEDCSLGRRRVTVPAPIEGDVAVGLEQGGA
jgi:hypothetical protein